MTLGRLVATLELEDKMTETNSSTSRCGGQLELFTRNLPKRPYAVDQLGDRLLITSPSRALRRRHIQANPPPACRMTRAGTGVSWVERTWTGALNQRWAEAVSHYRQREAAWLAGPF